jgi:Spy/CpxP family protein refolding chaperone
MNVMTHSFLPLLALAAVLSLTQPVGAVGQDSKPVSDSKPAGEVRNRPEGSAARVESMRQQRDVWMKELKLTDDQMAKLREINRAQADKLRALRQDTSLSQEDRRKKMQELRDANATALKGILSAEQFAKYTEMQGQRREGRRSRGAGAGAGAGPGTGNSGGSSPAAKSGQ